MTTADWVQTILGALALLGTWYAMWRKRGEANDALVRAKAADDRAEEALAIAKEALEAVGGLGEIEAERDRQKDLEAQAPALIRSWIVAARNVSPHSVRPSELKNARWVSHRVQIKTELQLIAARMAASHPEVRQVDPPILRIGGMAAIFVDNPYRRKPGEA